MKQLTIVLLLITGLVTSCTQPDEKQPEEKVPAVAAVPNSNVKKSN